MNSIFLNKSKIEPEGKQEFPVPKSVRVSEDGEVILPSPNIISDGEVRVVLGRQGTFDPANYSTQIQNHLELKNLLSIFSRDLLGIKYNNTGEVYFERLKLSPTIKMDYRVMQVDADETEWQEVSDARPQGSVSLDADQVLQIKFDHEPTGMHGDFLGQTVNIEFQYVDHGRLAITYKQQVKKPI